MTLEKRVKELESQMRTMKELLEMIRVEVKVIMVLLERMQVK